LSKFHDDLLRGSQIKDLIKVLLQKSGYSVFPYGYESTFSEIRSKLAEKGTKNSRTVRRIRSSPDLLVYDQKKKDLMLVEVKMRGAPRETSIKYLKRIIDYKEFWNDSILVVTVPCGDVMYAQRISELEVKPTYNAITDFEKIEEVLTKVKVEGISHYREKALQIMEKEGDIVEFNFAT
jgi:hypothetical protein